MARRIVGKYSPGAQDGTRPEDRGFAPPVTPAPIRTGFKAWFMFVLPFPFLIKAFFGGMPWLFTSLLAGGLLMLSAWLTREGVRAARAFEARRVARRPAFPRKLFGACLFGAGLMIASLHWALNPVEHVLFGFLAAALHLGAFGLDPMRAKGMEGVDSFQTDRVARAVAEAEATLAQMHDAILRARDGALESRVARFAAVARALFRQIENDPRDLTAARAYLSVYLQGARDATVKLADLLAAGPNAKARADYEALLTDLETNFAGRTQKLLSDDATGLDIEIQVLRDRLKYNA